MDIQTLKLDLVERIVKSENASILIKIKKLFQPEETDDWWEGLPREVQDSITEGLNDVDKGNVFTHEQIISEAKQKYGF
jgi:predicted transcriptional regulator